MKLTKCKWGLFSNSLTKNGFTLIELLAVIVILAVIALIATPIIMNVINDAKRGAAEDSVHGYIKAVELSFAKEMVKNPDKDYDGDYWITSDGNLKNTTTEMNVGYKGDTPTGALIIKNSTVVAADIQFSGNSFSYLKNEITKNSDNNVFPYARWNYHGIIGHQVGNVTIDWDKIQFHNISADDTYTTTYTDASWPGSVPKYGISVKAGEKYRFSWTTTAAQNRSMAFLYTDDNETFTTKIEGTTEPITVTIPEGIHYMAFRLGVTNGIGTSPLYTNLKLEKIN